MCRESKCKGKPLSLPCLATLYAAWTVICHFTPLVDLNSINGDKWVQGVSLPSGQGSPVPLSTNNGRVGESPTFGKRSSVLVKVLYQFSTWRGIWQSQNCSALQLSDLQWTTTSVQLTVGCCTHRVRDRLTTSVGCSTFKVTDFTHIPQLYRLQTQGPVLH